MTLRVIRLKRWSRGRQKHKSLLGIAQTKCWEYVMMAIPSMPSVSARRRNCDINVNHDSCFIEAIGGVKQTLSPIG